MNPNLRASLLFAVVLSLALPSTAWSRAADRTQPIYLDSDKQTATMDGNGISVWSGSVALTQGSMNIAAGRAELTQRNGDPVRAVFTGKPVTLKQQMDDGTTMTATADKIDYDLTTDTIIFTGNYTVTSPRGSNSGQRLVYDTRSGTLQGGGDGSRVRTVIQPRSAAAKPAGTR
ncbi:MAG: lipopolysaccharide transport periplasmic protein LptA [Pseudoxanthomonas sp.]|nr:lipopolysaccharide transport periplasmic protein LptA [Pseudoxanthomonas sp.]